jgi:lysophospholipase L1-like esterase
MTNPDRFDPAVRSASEEDDALRDAPWRRMVVLGDSITQGNLADPVEGLESLGWPERVARALRRAQPALVLINLGERDLTAAQVRQRQLGAALDERPDLAVVICGGNDVLGPQFDPAATHAEIDAIVEALQDGGADVAMLTTFDVAGVLDLPPTLAQRIAERMSMLTDVIRSVAEAREAILVDLFRVERGRDREIFSADQIHANELGHAIVASEVIGALGARTGSTRA